MTIQELQNIIAEAHEEAAEHIVSKQQQVFREAVLTTREAIRESLALERAEIARRVRGRRSPAADWPAVVGEVCGDSSQPTPSEILRGYAMVALIGVCIGTLIGKFLL